jgi:uncharacterized surface protein with fasciclin (FAS1) repeats
VLTAVATLSLVAAACGDDDSAGTSNVPVATAAAATAPTSSAMSTDAGQMVGHPFGPACSAVPTDGAGSFAGMANDPAATAASNNPVLSTLVTAVMKASLADTLNGDGPFTIFAPTNDAFAALPAADLQAVLANKDLLTKVLTYHVIAGKNLSASDLATAGTATTVEGDSLTFGPDGTTVNGAHVVCSDVMTANATVHIIDTVLMPPTAEMSSDTSSATSADMGTSMSGQAMAPSGPACASVPADGAGSFAGMANAPAATAASNNPLLSTLVSAVTQAGLVDTLNGDGPFTIFAPTNDAFAALPAADLQAVLANKDLLTSVLTYHVVAGKALSTADLIAAGTVQTVNGDTLTITDENGTLAVNGVPAVCMDVPTANATVHVIGGVLMPPAKP